MFVTAFADVAVGYSVVVIPVLEVTVTVLVLLKGIGSKGVKDADVTTVGADSRDERSALPVLHMRDVVSIAVG